MGSKKNLKDKLSKTIIFVILAALIIAVLVPYAWMISNSFKLRKETLMEPENIVPHNPSVEGYKKVLFDSPFFIWLKNSLIITITTTVAILYTSSLIGFVFSKYNFRTKDGMFAILLATMMVPAQVTMIPTFILINSMGLYNSLWAVIIQSFIDIFGIYLCKQFIDEIPRDILDSARIDGAGGWRIYFKVILPNIRPALGALGIFTFLNQWNDYLRPLIYLNSTDKMTLPLALNFFNSQHGTDLPATMAASVLIMIPVTIVFMIFQKQFIKGVSMTGMK